MTTMSEAPALPGDLTDETIERGALALRENDGEDKFSMEVYREDSRVCLSAAIQAYQERDPEEFTNEWMPRVLAAARVATEPDNGRCGGCRDLGPHRNVPGCDYYEPEPAPVTPIEPEWEHGTAEGEVLLARIMDALAYLHCKSMNPKADSPYMGYHAMSEDQREFLRERQREAAEEVLRMWHAEVTPAPSPDREWLAGRLRGDILDAVPDDNDMQHVLELAASALAVPPVVNEAKLAEIICNELLSNEDIDELWSLQEALAFSRQLAKDLLGPRQREWLETRR